MDDMLKVCEEIQTETIRISPDVAHVPMRIWEGVVDLAASYRKQCEELRQWREGQVIRHDSVKREFELVGELATLREELADVKRGYDRLDANWDNLNNVNVGAFRNVLNMPDASMPEMVKVISDTKEDRDRMRELVSSLTARIEAQAELLRARAEKPGV